MLTCRVAHLVEHNGLKPENICAVTFTNKAANEMKERLRKLIGDDRTLGLVMGKFAFTERPLPLNYMLTSGNNRNFSRYLCQIPADLRKSDITSE